MNNNTKKSAEMPEPQVAQYFQTYVVTPMFVNDLKSVIGDVAYVDAKKILDVVESYNGVATIAQINEVVNRISMLPYKIVSPIMTVLNNKDNFLKYFNPIPMTQPKN